ncbi:14066_t:CDS:2 [Entrophospora sp. SA101]|nr:14066_t:CDS:2 [Entrophospora sp. SA101]
MAEKPKFELNKEHINITTIGHVDHGKTTLSAAITKYAASKAPEEKARGITINAAHLELETQTRHYSLTDCPGHADYVKNMITGASQADGGILVVAATDGAMPQTKEHLRLARQIGIKHLVVFINKVDDVSDLSFVDLVEMEMRDLLNQYKFDGQKTPFVKGSALSALEGKNPEIGEQRIEELLNTIDQYIPNPVRDISKPFLMPIGKAETKTGLGTIATGNVLRGKLKLEPRGTNVEIVGLGPTTSAVATGIEMFHKSLSEALPGYDIGVLLRGIKREQIRRGQVLAAPGTIKAHAKFEATAYILTKEEGGRHTPFGGSDKEGKKAKSGKEYRPQFHFHTADVTGSISSPKNPQTGELVEMVMPGDNINFTVELGSPVAIENNTRFSIREVKNFTKRFGYKTVVNNASFRVKRGSIHGFIGPNGAGKSTTLNALMGLVISSGGELLIEEKKVITDPNFNANVGYVPAEPLFPRNMKVKSFIEFCGLLRDIPASQVGQKLNSSSLNSLLMALTRLKEHGLDPTKRTLLANKIKEVRSQGGTILMSTHILSDLQELADEITMIKNGKIVYTGLKTDDIQRTYEQYFVQDDKKNNPKKVTVKYKGPKDTEKRTFELEVKDEEQTVDNEKFKNVKSNPFRTSYEIYVGGSDDKSGND